MNDLAETYSAALGIVSGVIRDAPELAEMMFDTLWKYPETAHNAGRLIGFFVRADARRKARADTPAKDPEIVCGSPFAPLSSFIARADARRKARAASPAEDPEEVAAEIARQEYGSTT